jgi:hypothetical protein
MNLHVVLVHCVARIPSISSAIDDCHVDFALLLDHAICHLLIFAPQSLPETSLALYTNCCLLDPFADAQDQDTGETTQKNTQTSKSCLLNHSEIASLILT